MKVLNVRLEDAEHAALRSRAADAGLSVTDLVKGWITGLGVPDESSQSPDRSTDTDTQPGPSGGAEDVPPPASAGDASAPPTAPEFLAAPVDDCPLCGHARQESDHLGGRRCQFKLAPRRSCGCTYEGF